MCEFFPLNRRKVGIATLALACVTALIWIRSYYWGDVFECPLGLMNSEEGSILFSQSNGTFDWYFFPVDAGRGLARHSHPEIPLSCIAVPLTFLSVYLLLTKLPEPNAKTENLSGAVFFVSMRRTAGVVTLMMACVFAGAWVRSCCVTDQVSWRIARLMSFDGILAVIAPAQFERWPVWDVQAYRQFYSDPNDITLRWQFFGFRYYEAYLSPGSSSHTFMVPYWSIVLPLMLLSAYLLLRTRRKPTSGESLV